MVDPRFRSTLGPSAVTLEGRTAIVTGAANGIGRAIATVFARFGADVAVCDRDVPNLDSLVDEVEAIGRSAVAGELDVRDGEQAIDFVAEAVSHFGKVDILVNNAGGGFSSAFTEVNQKGEAALVRENFTSVTNFIRACARFFPDVGGSIINVTSIEAHRAAPMFAVYSAMKAAVENLTRSLALEFGDRLVRVNSIAPDVIPTPGLNMELGARTPLPIEGHVDDCAAAALYLATPLSRFVTGTTIHVDGGNWAAGGWRRAGIGGWTT